jgi:hypothetical protein
MAENIGVQKNLFPVSPNSYSPPYKDHRLRVKNKTYKMYIISKEKLTPPLNSPCHQTETPRNQRYGIKLSAMNKNRIIGSPLPVTTKNRAEVLKLEVKFERTQYPFFHEKSEIKN